MVCGYPTIFFLFRKRKGEYECLVGLEAITSIFRVVTTTRLISAIRLIFRNRLVVFLADDSARQRTNATQYRWNTAPFVLCFTVRVCNIVRA